MKIALIGYGKMGRTIEALGLQQGHTFPLIIDEDNQGDLNANKLKEIEVAIEFTAPVPAPENILACINLGIPVVSGTTGWNERFNEIQEHCRQKNGFLFYASNFSIGVNILFEMNQQLARIMEKFPAYRVHMKEVHHIHKVDAPSGTAISLAEQIIEESSLINQWRLTGPEQEEPASDDNDNKSLSIEAIREGEVKGIHSIHYESAVDSLSLSHQAKTRDAFAAGVLLAAEFSKGKSGVFGMSDLLNL